MEDLLINLQEWRLTNDCIENHGSGCVYQSAVLDIEDGYFYKGTAQLQDGEIKCSADFGRTYKEVH